MKIALRILTLETLYTFGVTMDDDLRQLLHTDIHTVKLIGSNRVTRTSLDQYPTVIKIRLNIWSLIKNCTTHFDTRNTFTLFRSLWMMTYANFFTQILIQ